MQSHFLKVPSLPFHSLISILSKFPSDDDSRVFWPKSLRDKLYGKFNLQVVALIRADSGDFQKSRMVRLHYTRKVLALI